MLNSLQFNMTVWNHLCGIYVSLTVIGKYVGLYYFFIVTLYWTVSPWSHDPASHPPPPPPHKLNLALHMMSVLRGLKAFQGQFIQNNIPISYAKWSNSNMHIYIAVFVHRDHSILWENNIRALKIATQN